VGLDRGLADEQPRRRAAVRLALGDQREDLELAGAQRVRCRRPELGQESGGDGRRQHGLAAMGRPDGADQRIARRVLEEVAGRPGRDRGPDVAVGVVRREDEDAGRVAARGEVPDRRRPVAAGHPQVHEDDVRVEPVGRRDRIAPI
jgi:hypothetical protein